jgi:hypothetical protein
MYSLTLSASATAKIKGILWRVAASQSDVVSEGGSSRRSIEMLIYFAGELQKTSDANAQCLFGY